MGKRSLTQEEFIAKAREIHGDKYDYSKVDYVYRRTKVCIICLEHGEFWQTPNDHLRGSGCPSCGNVKKLTTEEFIKRARQVHGDKYDYSKVEYINNRTKVCIICLEHGEVLQSPYHHLTGRGCPKCAAKQRGEKRALSMISFIEQAKRVHGDKYDYSKVEYVNSQTKVCIICPIHGEFWQIPSSHLRGSGCPSCGNAKNKTTEEFISQAEKVHNKRYDYSKVEYINATTKVCIICPKHGEFWQTPNQHLLGQGCPICSNTKKLTTNDFIKRAQQIHGNKYDYSKVEYVGSKMKIKIICPIHGEFWQLPTNHLQGSGCPVCSGGNGIKFFKQHKLSLLSEYDLTSMSTHQLLELIATDVLPKEWEKLAYTEPSSEKRQNSITELKDLYSNATDDEESDIETQHKLEEETKQLEKEYTSEKNKQVNLDDDLTHSTEDNFPELEEKTLKNYSKAYKNLISLGDKHRFIAEVEIHKIWNAVLKELSQKSDKTLSMLSSMEIDSEWLAYVKDTFFTEFNEVNEITVDSEYAFPYQPSLMQKLMVYRLMKNHSYGNWCGTGAGKTNAALLSTRLLNTRNNLIICPNSVIGSWKKAIQAIYPNSNVIVYKDLKSLSTLDRSKFNYIIFNVEKFQLNKRFEMIDTLLENNVIDFICLDEIQQMKVRNEKHISNRYEAISYLRSKAYAANNDIYVLGMTATPLINNLQEVKSILELITGKEYVEIGNKNTLTNIHLAYKGLLLNGFRYVPNYQINVNVIKPKVELNDEVIINNLIQFDNGNVDKIENLLTEAKLSAIMGELTPKTILYTHYHSKNSIFTTIKKVLKDNGISCELYACEGDENTDRDQIITDFKNGKFDILVASSPISTGVNGLQEISNKMVILSLPWTSAEYQQLLGRINRQGSIYNNVDIIIPQVYINDWSWDVKRYKIIEYKRTLSDAVIDGIFCETFELDKKTLLKQAIESLKKGIEDYNIQREDITTTVNTEDVELKKREYKESMMQNTHQRANTSSSSHMHSYFKSNPKNWIDYHKAREENKKTWMEDPLDVIADMINKNTTNINQVIADLGCGMNQLKTKVNNYKEWYSFDHYSEDPTVIHADVANLIDYLPNDSVDVAVFCLSLWGTNYMDYIKEASRYLKIGGTIYIAEPSKKVNQAVLIGESVKMGLNVIGIDIRHEKTYLTFKKVN